MSSISINETAYIVLDIIKKQLKIMEKDPKKKTRLDKFNKIRVLDNIGYNDIEKYINESLKNKYDKTTKLYLDKVLEQFIDYIKLTFSYKEFRDGLEKLLKVDFRVGIKTIELLDAIDCEDYEDFYNIEELYEENIKYKIVQSKTKYNKIEKKDEIRIYYPCVDKTHKKAIVSYACICGWCKGLGLQYLCIFKSDLFEGHFILGYVCNDNTEKYIELEKDPLIKSILKNLDIVIKSKHSDINKKRCMNTDCIDKDKRTVIKGREQELKFLKGNFCSKCIKIFNNGNPIYRECLKDGCKTTYKHWKRYSSKPHCLECYKKQFI